MAGAPFFAAFIVLQGYIGIPNYLRGFEFFFLCFYTGVWFMLLVILQRRADAYHRADVKQAREQLRYERTAERQAKQSARKAGGGRHQRQQTEEPAQEPFD